MGSAPRGASWARASTSTNTRSAGLRPSTASSSAPLTRYASLASSLRNGAPSPAGESTASGGGKRKARDDVTAESDAGAGEETNINVVVRCRGRNKREVKENSNVVVRTDGVKGKFVELSMGANALSNKSYNFDRVFSPAADQNMVFDDTVKPILEEMLGGYNCTIFAYGQTGTGKTYTMSGDMEDTMGMLSDEAGIIPRVLQQLFNRLERDDAENCVKCSFIELYNEELRDLLSVEETAKLKIFDDVSRRGHAGTIIQGMEERHIKTAAEGIRVLQNGSLRRQVAATKCNELSSRSHTVFTITAYVKKTNEHGVDDFVSAGKLNLVDLAGSENIQRSGAENKRAAEAGLINKSLLTLGRVINALVDRSAHIPYRESKLTRLLQDSLGGRTKTCIIATVSTAKSNLEETMSTLDYAFRAKNIRNKPQLNPMLNKKMLLNDFASEIERLKSELISTRQRNGVYLSNDVYEEMTAQSESRRIVLDEQAAKIETLETNLRNKVQELFSLNTAFLGLRKDHEGTKAQLDDAKGLLDQTEIVLGQTRTSLAQETQMRRAHEHTEEKLAEIGDELIGKLNKTVHDVGGLRAKNKRRSDLQSLNRAAWSSSQAQVADVTSIVERRVLDFRDEQLACIDSVSRRMGDFVGEELGKLAATQTFLDEHLDIFVESKRQMLEQRQRSKDDMDDVLEEMKAVRDGVKESMGQSLGVISRAAERMAADVVNELTGLHNTLHNSYSALGKDCKSIFEELVRHIAAQRSEADSLRMQLQSATSATVVQNASLAARVQETLDEERRQAAEDRQKLMAQMSALVQAQAESQEARMTERAGQMHKTVTESTTSLEAAAAQYGQAMDAWDEREGRLLDEVKKSRDQLKTRLKDDWTAASERSTTVQNTAKSVHAETVRVVDEQVEGLETQMGLLDELVARARSDNASHHESHSQSVQMMSGAVEQSFGSVAAQFRANLDRVKNLGEEMELDVGDLRDGLDPFLERQVCRPLVGLREGIAATALHEYQPTGETPQKTLYTYPTKLPRTAGRGVLLSSEDRVSDRVSGAKSAERSEGDGDDENDKSDDNDDDGRQDEKQDGEEEEEEDGDTCLEDSILANPVIDSTRTQQPQASKINNSSNTNPSPRASKANTTNPLSMSLREVDPNVAAPSMATNSVHGPNNHHALNTSFYDLSRRASTTNTTSCVSTPMTMTQKGGDGAASMGGLPVVKHTRASLKRQAASSVGGGGGGGVVVGGLAEGRENVPPGEDVFALGASRRKSPRMQ